jgi:hypothetical protein
MNAELQSFVRDSLARGLSRDTIREQLNRAGWRPEEIEAALAAWAESDFPVPVPRRRSYLSPREAFLYLVLFVTLYVTAFNVGALLFQFIERWLPDPAMSPGYSGADRFNPRAVRDSIAALLIAYPVFLYLSAFIGRMLVREPEKRGSAVRKWLTYITLFVAALVILGDLTFVVARLLSGELAPRFMARTLVVFLIAAYVFGHYLSDLRKEEDEPRDRRARGTGWLSRAAGVAVVAVVAVAFFLAGSPRSARFEEIDSRRVRELQQLSQAVENYYRERRELPASLDSLIMLPSIYVESFQDPVSRRPYEYRVVDPRAYELCATFDRTDTTQVYSAYPTPDRPPRFWRHGAGRRCYRLVLPRTLVDEKRP